MQKTNSSFQITKTGSTTYFYSSLFFPKHIRDQVFDLYSFVRVIDDYVDATPQQKKEYKTFKKDYYQALKKGSSHNSVINNFITLQKQNSFNQSWIDAFFTSMEMDLKGKKYHKLQDTIDYMHGSAEVIGLMMASIMQLPKKAHTSARMLGRSMQYVNFIRDIQEDLDLKRNYFSQESFKKYKLTSLEQKYTTKHPVQFKAFIRHHIHTYYEWQRQTELGFDYIPHRLRIPIATASSLYKWTANQIYQDPFLVYRKKLKPSKPLILKQIILQSVSR